MDHRPGISREKLKALLSPLNFDPPEDYLDFMSQTNGSEGPVGATAYLAIYDTEELLDCNAQTMTVEPGLLFFATNRGGEGYAFELDSPFNRIVAVEFADLDRTRARHVATTFRGFLEAMCS